MAVLRIRLLSQLPPVSEDGVSGLMCLGAADDPKTPQGVFRLFVLKCAECFVKIYIYILVYVCHATSLQLKRVQVRYIDYDSA